ncbi:MAG: DUF1501 domain-containing protein [Planctomycetia bacterium]|nr:DUF1501 domain-containing protein [Planctomycetia bacterium]
MGRTPKIKNSRDRADSGFAFFAGGGGLQMGQVIGQSDACGERVKARSRHR